MQTEEGRRMLCHRRKAGEVELSSEMWMMEFERRLSRLKSTRVNDQERSQEINRGSVRQAELEGVNMSTGIIFVSGELTSRDELLRDSKSLNLLS